MDIKLPVLTGSFLVQGSNLGYPSVLTKQVPFPTEAAQVLASKFVFLHIEALFWVTGFQ